MAVNKASAAADSHCPDPSMHQKQNKLSEQASSAALYVTNPNTKSERTPDPREDVLGEDGRLSSKSAAASLKYAKPHELPSFPSVGISTSSAGAAAVLAKDYKGKEMWKPEGTSSAGSRAALLAHRDGGKLDLWQPTASKDGNSAAALAMRNKTLSPQLDRGYTVQGKSNALLAATKSQSDTLLRTKSTPAPKPALYPDQANSARNALNAATVSHRSSVKAPPRSPVKSQEPQFSDAAMQAARVHNIGKNVDVEMWGERPPVEIELEEQRQKAALRASAVSMAKQMYDYQNRTVLKDDTAGTAGAAAAHTRAPVSQSQPDLKQEAMRYIHLQDAAQKLAQERLAKMDKNLEPHKFREHYGYDAEPHRSRLSMRGRPRQRASSEQPQEDGDSSDDEERARRVRRQMTQFNTAIADVDTKKKESDRKALLAAAERNVHKSMDNMDERVFQSTGKVSQAKMDEWAAKARKKAEEEAKLRGQHQGKMHIGGGKFMDQAEIEAIAQSRLQPTLDEINDTAEKKRAKDEEIRLDKEEQERQKRSEKQKQKEEKDEQKQIKQDEKAVAKKEKDERKAVEKAEKEEKARKNAEEKEEKRKSMEVDGERKPERKSLLSRLASKRKSRNVTKDEADAATAGPATDGAVAVEGTEEIKRSTEIPGAAGEGIQEAEVVGAPLSPVHTRSSATPKTKPDLERHITNVETSSESESDGEASRERKREKKRKSALGWLSAGKSDKEDAADGKDAELIPSASTAGENSTDAPIIAPATASTKATKSILDPELPRESTASSRPDVEKEKEKDSKRIRGFFTKLRNRQSSKAERKPGSFSAAAPREEEEPSKDAGAADKTEEGPSTAAPAAIPTASDPRPTSPSSFNRHHPDSRKSSTDLGDVSSLSSSGLDEDDLQAGRTGRMARALGLKKGKGNEPQADEAKGEKVGKGVKSDDDDSDQFEEARDHFDEGLAPRPSFAGQAKSASPARETRFHEEV
ncbi:hypothetical protein Q7P37_002756 [Cladosporium fusiforme]